MRTAEMTVLVYDAIEQDTIPRSNGIKILRNPDPRVFLTTGHVFILASVTTLPEVAGFVHSANQRHHLRALLVRDDIELRWLPQWFDRAGLRTFRHTLVYSDPVLPRRVITAWQIGAQDHLVADACVIDNRLYVINCALGRLEVSFDEIPALRRVPGEHRTLFTIADDGSYLHWPDPDVHLDIDAILYATDPAWHTRREIAKASHNRLFGQGIAAVRKAHGLRQSDIHGLSARQLRRIEQGGQPTVKALEALARNHGMTLDVYLNVVAQRTAD